MTTLGVDALEELLPHRYPFLLVDRVEVVEPGRRVTGYKRVTGNEWWAERHAASSAGQAEMPHALVLEALAQTSGALVRDLLDGAGHAMAYFMGAQRVRFRAPALPGSELQLDLSLVQWKRGICRAHGVASVEGRVVVSAELTTVVRATG